MNRPDPPGERGSDFLEVNSFSLKYYPLTEITEVDDDDESGGGDLNDKDINDDDKSETNSLDSVSYHREGTLLQVRENDCDDEIIEAPTFLDGADMQTMPRDSTRDIDTSLTSSQVRLSVSRHDSPTTDPSEAISFYRLCTRLESVWRQRFRKSIGGCRAASSTRSKEQIFGLLVDDSLRSYLADSSSWFPFWRLIMPDLDTTRPHTGMKERTIALAWADAMNLTPGSRPYQRLLHYSDPTYFGDVGKSNLSATSSDLSLAIQEVVEPRDGTQGSKLTIKHINDMLDDLVAIKGGTMFQPIRSNHDWRETNSQSKKRQGPSLRQRRCDWVNQLRSKKLSALEHKWLVRILLQKMELGFSSKSMLIRWMPSALDVYRMNNNLKSVCLTVSNPMWIQAQEEKKKNQQLLHEKSHKLYWMEKTSGEAILGNTIAPMLSLKVYFRDAMAELCRVHRAHAKKKSKLSGSLSTTTLLQILPLKHPAFICEVKLDGERMIVHVKRGIVTMHTRRGRWYSDMYSPVLAPSIRRAIAKWDVDVVLDGEIIAWDNAKQETIPFGNNRTVALARERWMEAQGCIDPRDRNLHAEHSDLNVMTRGYMDGDHVETVAGSDCWLRYEVFDILYVGGPQSRDLISIAAMIPKENVEPGSIIHLNGFQRKRILHHLIEEQEKEVVLVLSLVVRPNGVDVKANDYFSATNPCMEQHLPASLVDSIEWGLYGTDEQHQVFSAMRGRCTDVELGLRRAIATDRFYTEIVDNRGMEGVILKDLNASYLLEGRKYWYKHKPDYEDHSELGDIDLIILGAFHGTGMGPSGKLNAFLCGCIDHENPDTFMPIVRVNGGSVSHDVMDQFLASTGYKKQTNTEPWSTGKWFHEYNHGKDLPDFISKRGFQYEERKSPTLEKKKYPDLWIRPEDSVVLTLKASEIVTTDAFQTGITLRFPRIERLRLKNSGDDKDARQVETLEGLLRAFREQMQRREGSGQMGDLQPPNDLTYNSRSINRRFQTAEEGLKRKGNTRQPVEPVWIMPYAERKESSALKGLTITVLEGVYYLEDTSLDAEEAQGGGWINAAREVRSRDDILLFISKHSGTPSISVGQDTDFVIGGRSEDSRVVMHHKGLENVTKLKSRKRLGLTSERMMEIGGVLKWTYLYSIVHKWINEMKAYKVENDQELETCTVSCIRLTHPQLLSPSRHYMLATTSPSVGKIGNDVYGIKANRPCTLLDFKRALQLVSNERMKKKRTIKASDCNVDKKQILPWQYQSTGITEPDIRWCLRGAFGTLWPFTRECGMAVSQRSVILYPDIFDFDFGDRIHCSTSLGCESGDSSEKKRWESIALETGPVASCLPLARAMGALVSPHLHDHVSHVLCELTKDYISWDEFSADSFGNPKRAYRIKNRLGTMHGDSCRVSFVSPRWIRNQWKEFTTT